MGYGLEGTEDVEVTVVDSNDHCPVFAAKWARGDPVGESLKIFLLSCKSLISCIIWRRCGYYR